MSSVKKNKKIQIFYFYFLKVEIAHKYLASTYTHLEDIFLQNMLQIVDDFKV